MGGCLATVSASAFHDRRTRKKHRAHLCWRRGLVNGRCHGGKRWAPHHLTWWPGLSFLCPLGFRKGRIRPSSGTTARDCEALAVCPKSRLGPAHSSELFGDGAQNWGGSIQKPQWSLGLPGGAQLAPQCVKLHCLQPELGLAACGRRCFLSDIPLHTRPLSLVSTRVSAPGGRGAGSLAPHFPFPIGQGTRRVSSVEVLGSELSVRGKEEGRS